MLHGRGWFWDSLRGNRAARAGGTGTHIALNFRAKPRLSGNIPARRLGSGRGCSSRRPAQSVHWTDAPETTGRVDAVVPTGTSSGSDCVRWRLDPDESEPAKEGAQPPRVREARAPVRAGPSVRSRQATIAHGPLRVRRRDIPPVIPPPPPTPFRSAAMASVIAFLGLPPREVIHLRRDDPRLEELPPLGARLLRRWRLFRRRLPGSLFLARILEESLPQVRERLG
jgi:hypothetical protein